MRKKVSEFFAKSGDYVKELSEETGLIAKKKKFPKDEEHIDWAFDKFRTRRSCRSFSDKKVDEELVYNIIDTSLRSPCAGGIQNVYVIEVFDEHVKHDLARSQTEQTWIGEAPVVLVVLSDKSKFEEFYPHDAEDLSMQNATVVTSSILFLAKVAGLDACWVKAGENDEVAKILHYDSSLKVDSIIPVGYAGEGAFRNRDYLPTSERFFFNSFGNRNRFGGGHH